MRLGVPLKLYPKAGKSLILDISYQASMLSLIKLGLSNTNPRLFHQLYDSNQMKNFATSVFFPHARFQGKKISLGEGQNAVLYFSTSDVKLGLNFFNAFQWLRNGDPKTFNSDLNVKVGRVVDVPVPIITSERAVFKTMSPLVVRRQDGYFLSCIGENATNEYQNALRESIEIHQSSKKLKTLAEQLTFKPLKMKKTVINPFGQFIEASMEMFELTANPVLQNEFLNSGLGGKRGSFAGMLGLVKEVRDND